MATSALAELGQALIAFMDARRAVDEALQRAPVRAQLRHRVGDLAEDVIQATELLIDAYDTGVQAQELSQRILAIAEGPWPEMPEAVRASEDPAAFAAWVHANRPAEAVIVNKLGSVIASLEVTERPHARAKLAFKHLFFVIRALQDALYAAFLEVTGSKAGNYSSVKDGLKSGKALREILDSRASDYPAWFSGWRDKRNRVKDGVNFGITGYPDFGITINTVGDDGALVVDCSGDSSIYAVDVTHALEASTELATIVAGLAIEQASADGRD